MFQENLKTYRKAKGLTQEDLAVRLHVVRQTISKWEKGLSVPDAALLVRLSEVLEVPVSQLLGAPLPPESSTDQVAEQLARINEQLAQKNRRAGGFGRWWWASCWPSSFYGGFFACSPTTPIPSTSPHQKFRWSRSPPFR